MSKKITKKTKKNEKIEKKNKIITDSRVSKGSKKLGRPPTYSRIGFAKKVDEYLLLKSKEETPFVTVLDFCVFAGVYKDFISEHNKRDGSNQDFSESIKKLKTFCENSLQYLSATGKINPAIAIFSLKNNYGWTEKNEISGAGGAPLSAVTVEIVNPKNETKP